MFLRLEEVEEIDGVILAHAEVPTHGEIVVAQEAVMEVEDMKGEVVIEGGMEIETELEEIDIGIHEAWMEIGVDVKSGNPMKIK